MNSQPTIKATNLEASSKLPNKRTSKPNNQHPEFKTESNGARSFLGKWQFIQPIKKLMYLIRGSRILVADPFLSQLNPVYIFKSIYQTSILILFSHLFQRLVSSVMHWGFVYTFLTFWLFRLVNLPYYCAQKERIDLYFHRYLFM